MAPHHFVLTDEALETPIRYDTNSKMNPPLREAADRDAMLEGIADGTVDVIATDHAPHHADEKRVEFDRAPFGIVGLETARAARLRPAGARRTDRRARALIELLSANPARVLPPARRVARRGRPADITMLAPDATVTDSRARRCDRNRRTRRSTAGSCAARVAATIVGGTNRLQQRRLSDWPISEL